MKNQVFVQGPLTCIDMVTPDGRSQIERQTLEEIQARYPGAEISDLETWSAAKEKALCTEPEEITEERFWEMLEVLPPQRWQRGRTLDDKPCQSFEMCEHLSGRVTSIVCEVAGRFFTWNDVAGKRLAVHAGRIVAVVAQTNPELAKAYAS